jgi:hypothetical protein
MLDGPKARLLLSLVLRAGASEEEATEAFGYFLGG